MNVTSELTTLQEITKQGQRFRVPIYQRLFVWGHDQVQTLLEDLWTAFEQSADIFYLGGTIVIDRQEDNENWLELVDGQQRFTTLWMMSLAWGGELTPFRRDQCGIPRITFPIRPDVDTYFRGQLDGQEKPLGYAPLDDALAQLRSFAARPNVARAAPAFLRFLFERVKLVLTRVPADTDLNRLYEVINSRGQQLRHHDILKARMLRRLPASQRQGYARLWEACAEMGAYVERSLMQLSGLRARDLVPDAGAKKDAVLRSASKLLAVLRQAGEDRGDAVDLATILADRTAPATSEEAAEAEETDAVDARSILSFPMLLQHTLRVWLHERSQGDLARIADKDLLAMFEAHFPAESAPADVRSFIELLWELRYVFDKHVVKWVQTGDEEHLSRARIRVYEDKKRRTTRIYREPLGETDAYTLLQAMLYHSQQITTHYWLTPFLAYLWRHRPSPGAALAYLRHVDNNLLCRAAPSSLVEMSAEFLADTPGSWRRGELSCSLLDEPHGVAFPHYWFYKLEFVLWDRKRDAFEAETLRTFRITARNSVEHVSPQQPKVEDTNRVGADMLNRFGNLGLVSRSINSEYGNLPFNEKRQRFQNRNRGRADSLKLALIYKNTTWNDRLATAHEAEMKRLIREYLATDFAKSAS